MGRGAGSSSSPPAATACSACSTPAARGTRPSTCAAASSTEGNRSTRQMSGRHEGSPAAGVPSKRADDVANGTTRQPSRLPAPGGMLLTPDSLALIPMSSDATPAPAPSVKHPQVAVGTPLAGRYRIVRFIAAGGMGEVYEAEDLMLGTGIALKTIRPDVAAPGPALDRFRRETLLARRVTHPNVCRIFDLGQHSSSGSSPDLIFLTMELLSGETLQQLLQRHGPLTVREALPLVVQMASALAAAHDAGVVHRDFKPANIMLVPAPSPAAPPRMVVTDFGVAWAAGSSLNSITGTNELVGTPAYMAPE